MNTDLHQRSVIAATSTWLRGHVLLVLFAVFTVLALAVAAAQSLYAGSVLPLVVFLILGVFIVPGMLRLTAGGLGKKDKHD